MAYTKVVVVGGGFGGLNAAQALKRANVDVLLIDKTNHHLFQPLLYQVASAALSPGNIAAPIREILRKQKNASVIMADIVGIDKDKRIVISSDGASFPYDFLILAPGSHHSYFGNDDWEEYAPGLKTLVDAIRIREKVLMAFEKAERCDSYSESLKYLRFVIVGGGPTGVEMAGAVAEIAHKTMFQNFRKIKPEYSEIYLIEGGGQILPAYPKHLGDKALQDLERMGVKVLLNTPVTKITKSGVHMGSKFLETTDIIWAAGNQASPLLKTLEIPLDKNGLAVVEPDLSVPGHPELFIIGDAARVYDTKGKPLPAIAPAAIQQAKYVSKIIQKNIPKEERKPFRYFDKGSMATIGKAKAVAMVGKVELSGFLAWLSWCFIHIVYLISFRNRIIVMIQWFIWYITGSRTVRLITKPIYSAEEHRAWQEDVGAFIFEKSESKDGKTLD